MWLLIIPLVILLVIVLSLTSLAAALIGALGAHWPWLLIALGVWMFWRGDGRYRRRRRDQYSWSPRKVPPSGGRKGPAVADQQPQSRPTTPTPIKPQRTPELPIDVQVKVEQIRRKVEVLLSFADRFPPFSKDLFLVRQTATEYLPRTVDAYLALPEDAAERPLASTGQTPHQELKAQLDLLDAKLDEIAQDLQSQDVDRLLANRRFLEERFGDRASA
jgi:hypothetical protein